MKIFIFPLICFFTLTVKAGEISNLFEHQNIINNGFSDNNWEKNKPQRVKEKFEIGLERNACQLTCPVYSVIINQKGEFSYFGEKHVKNIGAHTGTISLKVVKKLFSYINTIKYFSLRDSYSIPRSEGTRVLTYVKLNNREKVISNHYNSAPASVWALELMIDEIINHELKILNNANK